jgi:hypothetical protein
VAVVEGGLPVEVSTLDLELVFVERGSWRSVRMLGDSQKQRERKRE